VTQQRSEGGDVGEGWSGLFDRSVSALPRYDLEFAARQLEMAGLRIVESHEADTPMTFTDIGAVVYYLRAVPWCVEGFDPDRDRPALERLHDRISADGALLVGGTHFLIEASAG